MSRDNWIDWRQVKPKRRSRCKMFLERKRRRFKLREFSGDNNYQGMGENYRGVYSARNKKPR